MLERIGFGGVLGVVILLLCLGCVLPVGVIGCLNAKIKEEEEVNPSGQDASQDATSVDANR